MLRRWWWVLVAVAVAAAVVTVAVWAGLSAREGATEPSAAPTATLTPVDPSITPAPGDDHEHGHECLPLTHEGEEGECGDVEDTFEPDTLNWELTGVAEQFVHDWYRIDTTDPAERDARLKAWVVDGARTTSLVEDVVYGQVGMVTTSTTQGKAVSLPWPSDGDRAVIVTVNIEVTYTAPEQGTLVYRGPAQAVVFFDNDGAVTAVQEQIAWLTNP